MELKAYVTNLGKYNEGILIGEWVEFPVSEEELEEVFARIGIDGVKYEEYFITDYVGIWAGSMKDEYISIERLNDIAETLQKFDEDVLSAALEYWWIDDVLEMNPDDLIIYIATYTTSTTLVITGLKSQDATTWGMIFSAAILIMRLSGGT